MLIPFHDSATNVVFFSGKVASNCPICFFAFLIMIYYLCIIYLLLFLSYYLHAIREM